MIDNKRDKALKMISKTPLYNLNAVLREGGLTPDVLRAWERRYQLPVPRRTAGGHRLYSQYDIETIKWFIRNDIKIDKKQLEQHIRHDEICKYIAEHERKKLSEIMKQTISLMPVKRRL